jgi:CheY-like chemotaxis protein
VSRGPTRSRRVYLLTRDLLFRGKLGAVCTTAGADVVRDEQACDVAVVELDAPGAADRLRGLVERSVPVLAFGSHVNADQLRAAREAGAQAVPNSQVEARLRGLLERLSS